MSTGDVHPFNPMKVLWHRDKIELMQQGTPTRGPVSLEWDLSNTCSHNCGFCSFGTKESNGYRQQNWQHFPTERALRLVPELKSAGVESITFTGGGEPLNHPQAARIFELVHQHGIEFGLVTNGQLLRGRVAGQVAEHAVFVRVSWDAGLEATHQAMHRTTSPQLAMIEEQMAEVIVMSRASERAHPLTVGASFCVTDTNFREIEVAARRLKNIGADYLEVRPTFPTTWRGDGWDFALHHIQAARDGLQMAQDEMAGTGFSVIGMVERFDALDGYSKGYDRCQIGPLTSVLGAEGTLWHCCVQRGRPEFALANVLDQSFDDAWAAAQAKHMADVIDVTRCPRCRYDGLNSALAGIHDNRFHLAFI